LQVLTDMGSDHCAAQLCCANLLLLQAAICFCVSRQLVVVCQVLPEDCQYLEFVKILYLANQVVLQVQYAQLRTQLPDQLNCLNILLVQGHLFQVGQHVLIMFCPLQ
jgi:hypothetical protein